MPTDSYAVVCVLHGDPPLPRWMAQVGPLLHLVVNDPGPGRYEALPPARDITVNDEPAGFAANVNAALGRLWASDWPVAVCVNFDLDLEPGALAVLAEAALEPGTAVAGAVLSDARGRPVFSVGSQPTRLKELSRAVGLRGGRPQRLLRGLLRQLPAWRRRNSAGRGDRALGPGEYLPWTCVALTKWAWETVGPLDERFFLYAEDLDWGRRAEMLGLSARLVDCGPIVHAERATRSRQTDDAYEQSMLDLHRKWGHRDLARCVRAGWRVRRALRLLRRRLASREDDRD